MERQTESGKREDRQTESGKTDRQTESGKTDRKWKVKRQTDRKRKDRQNKESGKITSKTNMKIVGRIPDRQTDRQTHLLRVTPMKLNSPKKKMTSWKLASLGFFKFVGFFASGRGELFLIW